MHLNEQRHSGDVISHTHPTCLVSEPVTVVLEGNATALALWDAKALLKGLAEAVARVEESEKALLGDGDHYNVCVIGDARSGMSLPRTKLGVGGPAVILDPVRDANLRQMVFDICKSDVVPICQLD